MIGNKAKGIARVTGANIFSLASSLLISFILPIVISVENYGYWQLFVLYSGYAGLFAWGFNDGVSLNYAAEHYDNSIQRKFKSFMILLSYISIIEMLLLILILLCIDFDKNLKFILLVSVFNIYPTLLNGLFIYMNQCTLRFKQYSKGCIVDKCLFLIILVFLIIGGCKQYQYYIIAFTISRYIIIPYNYKSSIEVFKATSIPIKELISEIKQNVYSGILLMIAVTLNGSIIVGSRFLIEARFGIEEFGAYSLSIHTFIIASQFISAIATVFYPILKRTSGENYTKTISLFDKFSTIFSSVLLLSYFCVVVIIGLIYKNYIGILDYLMFVYPIFIFQCKSNLIIFNIYKVKNQVIKLICLSLIAICLHLVSIFVAYLFFGTVLSIAVAVLISYCLWYYIGILIIHKEEHRKLKLSSFSDLLLLILFLVISILTSRITNIYIGAAIGFFSSLLLLLFIFFCLRGYIKSVIREFLFILK